MKDLESRVFSLELELEEQKIFIEESNLPKIPLIVQEDFKKPADEESKDTSDSIPNDIEIESQISPPYRRTKFEGTKSGGWRRRCNCSFGGTCSTSYGGTSYIHIACDLPDYDIRIIIVPHKYDNWRSIIESHRQYRFFNTSGGYITNFYDGSGGGAWTNKGTIGYEVLSKGTDTVHSRWIQNPDFSGWGENWLRCGITYELELEQR